jgi:hypothetical protein
MALSNRVRRANRTTVLSWLLAFAAIQIGFAVALDGPLAGLRNPDYVDRRERLRAYRDEHPGQPVIVVLGSSRTMYGVCPGSLIMGTADSAQPLLFNFGLCKHGPMHEALVLDRMLADGLRPDGLIVEIVPGFLSVDPESFDTVPVIWYSWREMQGLANLKTHPQRDWDDWFEARTLPCFSYRYNIMHRLVPAWLPDTQKFAFWSHRLDRCGWFESEAKAHEPQTLESARTMFWGFTHDFRVADAHRRGMQHLLTTCRREQIPVKLLLMPESPGLRSAYAPEANAVIVNYLAELQREYAVSLIDASQWLDSELLFQDGHHLLPEGARQFTVRLGNETRSWANGVHTADAGGAHR